MGPSAAPAASMVAMGASGTVSGPSGGLVTSSFGPVVSVASVGSPGTGSGPSAEPMGPSPVPDGPMWVSSSLA
eukprot:1580653-Prorocentrum_lima.AAC.1